MKKRIAAAIVAAAAALLAVGGTMAWFTDDREAVSVVQTGNVDIEIVENTREPEGAYEKTVNGIKYKGNFMPGQTFSKIVKVKNKGVNRAFVRVKVSYQGEEDKELSYDPQLVPEVKSSGLGSSGDSWELASDGYYYYNQALEPGAETAPMMEEIHLPLKWELEQTSALRRVVIGAEAIQADYTGKDAKEAFGYKEVVSGIIAEAMDLTSKFRELAETYQKASGQEKEETLNQIRELMGAGQDAGWGIINNNDMFRKALAGANVPWPTVEKEGLANELHMSEEESQNWYVNIYVIVKDNYRVVPYISRASKCGAGEQWKARYVKIDGKWYQPASADSPAADTTGMINTLYSEGWDGIKEDWKLVDFGEP